jgi:hypothetical protein
MESAALWTVADDERADRTPLALKGPYCIGKHVKPLLLDEAAHERDHDLIVFESARPPPFW